MFPNVHDRMRSFASLVPRLVPRRYRDAIHRLTRELREDRFTGLAAEIAFFAVLSAFPWLLLMTAALGWFAQVAQDGVADEAKRLLLTSLDQVLTQRASGAVAAARDVFEQERVGVVSLSALLAVWLSSRGFAAMISALNLAYDTHERRPWLQVRLRALALALGSVLAAAFFLLVFVAGPTVVALRYDVPAPVAVVEMATGLVSVAGAVVIYAVAPSRSGTWRENVAGAILAAGFGVVASLGFGVYLRFATAGNLIYGVLGGGLALLVWLYLLAVGLLIGAEVNALKKRTRRGSEVVRSS